VKLSVVIPSFNQAEFLSRTLDSLVGQADVRNGELELIVIDGGSSDGSIEILRRYSDRLAYWVSEADRGQTHALIKGFARAAGDIFAWLCADDLLEPRAIREVLDYFAAHPEVEFIYGDGVWIDEAGNRLRLRKEIPFHWFLWVFSHNYIPQPSAFWRRQLYEQVGGLDETLELGMDEDLWARFALVTHPCHVPRLWSRIRRYPTQKSQRLSARAELEHRIIRRRVGRYPQNRAFFCFAHPAARALRIGLKLVNGCYW
jgi:glycosyltransferase involved in cell wall biosynthesis